MSVTAEGTSNRTSSPVVMTTSTVVPTPHRLRRSVYGKDVFIDNRCPFQMAGYPYHQFVQWPDND